MSKDRSETRDLAAAHPARVKKMAAAWESWAKASYVDPWKASYDPPQGGRPMQNWGGGERPKHPEAMDRKTPAMERLLQAG